MRARIRLKCLSTTVAIEELMPHAVCSGNTWPTSDASVATATRPGSAGPSDAGRRRGATGAGEFPARSAGCEAPARLERREAARPRRTVFFKHLDHDGPRAQDDQER